MILDTNAVSALAESTPGASHHFSRAAQVYVPSIVLGEFRFGIAQSRFRTKYDLWLEELVAACQVLSVDAETAVHYAALRIEVKRAGTPIPSNDIWIGALCRQHALPILSQDQHFDWMIGVRRLRW